MSPCTIKVTWRGLPQASFLTANSNALKCLLCKAKDTRYLVLILSIQVRVSQWIFFTWRISDSPVLVEIRNRNSLSHITTLSCIRTTIRLWCVWGEGAVKQQAPPMPWGLKAQPFHFILRAPLTYLKGALDVSGICSVDINALPILITNITNSRAKALLLYLT